MKFKKDDRVSVEGVVVEIDTYPRDDPYVKVAMPGWNSPDLWLRTDKLSLVSREEEDLIERYTRKRAELGYLLQEVLRLDEEISENLFSNFLDNVLVDPRSEAESWLYHREDFTKLIKLALVDWAEFRKEWDEYRKDKYPDVLLH